MESLLFYRWVIPLQLLTCILNSSFLPLPGRSLACITNKTFCPTLNASSMLPYELGEPCLFSVSPLLGRKNPYSHHTVWDLCFLVKIWKKRWQASMNRSTAKWHNSASSHEQCPGLLWPLSSCLGTIGMIKTKPGTQNIKWHCSSSWHKLGLPFWL